MSTIQDVADAAVAYQESNAAFALAMVPAQAAQVALAAVRLAEQANVDAALAHMVTAVEAAEAEAAAASAELDPFGYAREAANAALFEAANAYEPEP